jgi:hypothetical protein
MKKITLLFTIASVALGLLTANAQPGGGGPNFTGSTAKIFGDNQQFSAALEFVMTDAKGRVTTMPGKLTFDTGKSRFEMNMSEVKGGGIPPEAIGQMKAMGMDNLVSIARPDIKSVYVIYPGLQSYLENPVGSKIEEEKPEDFKIETTELGKETVDGHDCIKNKVVVTGKDGKAHESTVWNATDLKKFPIKIQNAEQGNSTTMTFKNISFAKPEASTFEVPASYAKYSDPRVMMQDSMMKKMGGTMGRQPGQ